MDGKDPSEQWRAQKQSKEEKRAARKAKLDPANQKSALDVMKEREKKRKRELGIEDVEPASAEPTDERAESGKRVKTAHENGDADDKRRQKAEKRKEKRERKKEKAEKLRSRREARKARPEAEESADPKADGTTQIEDGDQLGDADTAGKDDEVDITGFANSDHDELAGAAGDDASSAPSSPVVDSPAFDISANHSTVSSSSSILPPANDDELGPKDLAHHVSQPQNPSGPSKPALSISLPRPSSASSLARSSDSTKGTASPKLQLPNIDQAVLQERLRTRIEELRARRKADGPDGQPAKSRQELLDQRRKKEDQRKAHKKELRRKAKEEEALKQEERLRGSGSPLSGGDIFSPRTEANNFSFSRLAFGDGSMADPSASTLVDAPRRKGPQDAKGALMAAENKQKRLSGLDEQKRADIGEKDLWLNAKKRAHGERVRDDTSLLKKALKRKEKQKGKSELAWQEREQSVVKGKEMKQKKREGNLAKRRQEKGGKKGSPIKKGQKKGRPGFEGRFKA